MIIQTRHVAGFLLVFSVVATGAQASVARTDARTQARDQARTQAQATRAAARERAEDVRERTHARVEEARDHAEERVDEARGHAQERVGQRREERRSYWTNRLQMARQRLEEWHQRRLVRITEIRNIADERGDKESLTRLDRLEERLNAIYQRRTDILNAVQTQLHE